MSRYDAEARQYFIDALAEGLAEAGFTGISIKSAPMPEATVAALKSGGEDDDEIPFGDPTFAEEVAYHRITTDQGSFGLWLEPYVTLDLAGSGVPVTAFIPAEQADDVPAGWAFIGLEEQTFKKLHAEFAKLRG
jgi:hypothetical protein